LQQVTIGCSLTQTNVVLTDVQSLRNAPKHVPHLTSCRFLSLAPTSSTETTLMKVVDAAAFDTVDHKINCVVLGYHMAYGVFWGDVRFWTIILFIYIIPFSSSPRLQVRPMNAQYIKTRGIMQGSKRCC